MRLIKFLMTAALLFCGLIPALAVESFVVRHIQLRGLQYMSEGTVLHYLPIQVGQSYTSIKGAQAIEELYQTGFFSNVNLSRSGDTLIVSLQERGIIGQLNFVGNKAIATKKLQEALRKIGVTIGAPVDDSKLNQIQEGLIEEYDQLGYHAAQVTINLAALPGNRTQVNVHIKEGPVAKIHSIKFIGNQSFSKRLLLKNFKSTTPGLFTFINHRDRYSENQLDQDLEDLKNFYLDHGYLQFHVVSKQAIINPNGRSVDIIIQISEGPVYEISGFHVNGEHANDPGVEKIFSKIRPGHVFSRSVILQVTQDVQNYLADQGYAFAQVNIGQNINEQDHTAFLTFIIQSGHEVYVRWIHFTGNYRTQDLMLRGELRQMEGGIFSLDKVNESKRRLANLPYLKNIDVTPVPVSDLPDQVDLDYNMNEIAAGKASVQAGYSDVDGFLYGANITEPNFLGTGRYVSIGFNRSDYQNSYDISYSNPFYTLDGISRAFDVYYNQTTAKAKLNLDTFSMNDIGGAVSYGIPMSDYDLLSLGYGYDFINLFNINQVSPPNFPTPGNPNPQQPPVPAAAPILQFTNTYGSRLNQFNGVIGWSHSTLDQAVFPNKGTAQTIAFTIGAPIIHSAVGYYKATYTGKWYFPLGYGFVFGPHTDLGYGGGYGRTDLYPFYNNFYAGGIDTLPGFEVNSLGVKNPNNNFNSIGGNVEFLGGLNFIFPNFITDKIRTALFLDAGNVFGSDRTQYTAAQFATNPGLLPMVYESISLKNLRVSTGLMISWYSPLGPLEFYVGTPIVKKHGDFTKIFDFSMGVNL